jgi:hypothetical protein
VSRIAPATRRRRIVTHFVRAGTDPTLIPLLARSNRIEFVAPRDYPRC